MSVLLVIGSSMIVLIHTITHGKHPPNSNQRLPASGGGRTFEVSLKGSPNLIIADHQLQNKRLQDQKQDKEVEEPSDEEGGSNVDNERHYIPDEEEGESNNEENDDDDKEIEEAGEQEPAPAQVPTLIHLRRTTNEANESLNSQPSKSVEGEKYLKSALKALFILQQAPGQKEKSAPIYTRFVGKGEGEEKYWINSSATDDDRNKWLAKMKEANLILREIEKKSFVSLFGDINNSNVNSGSSDSLNTNKTDKKVVVKDNKKSNGGQRREGFPSPADNPSSSTSSHVILAPTIGSHRCHSDAIFAFAEGYDLNIYLGFIESLQRTGFSGDLVLSVSSIRSLKPGVEEYLRSFTDDSNGNNNIDEKKMNIVVYTVEWKCFDSNGEVANGANEGTRRCELVGMYGNDENEVLVDWRDARPVATARYELYWAWSLKYDPHSWIMLIDSRDTYFQLDPFETAIKTLSNDEEMKEIEDNGLLYFFGENFESSTIGQSKFNSRWLNEAYGKKNVSSFFDQQIICSGSSMGEQIAIETYLRAMVHQFDRTKCKMKGCDQGFHNYLYYSGSLSNGVGGIRETVVFDQGKGIINNLAALRIKTLKNWGVLKDGSMDVLNWDGSVSQVVHQFDRDDELNKFVKNKRKAFKNEWKLRKME